MLNVKESSRHNHKGICVHVQPSVYTILIMEIINAVAEMCLLWVYVMYVSTSTAFNEMTTLTHLVPSTLPLSAHLYTMKSLSTAFTPNHMHGTPVWPHKVFTTIIITSTFYMPTQCHVKERKAQCYKSEKRDLPSGMSGLAILALFLDLL